MVANCQHDHILPRNFNEDWIYMPKYNARLEWCLLGVDWLCVCRIWYSFWSVFFWEHCDWCIFCIVIAAAAGFIRIFSGGSLLAAILIIGNLKIRIALCIHEFYAISVWIFNHHGIINSLHIFPAFIFAVGITWFLSFLFSLSSQWLKRSHLVIKYSSRRHPTPLPPHLSLWQLPPSHLPIWPHCAHCHFCPNLWCFSESEYLTPTEFHSISTGHLWPCIAAANANENYEIMYITTSIPVKNYFESFDVRNF